MGPRDNRLTKKPTVENLVTQCLIKINSQRDIGTKVHETP
jgi:hypothetical protein